MAKIDPYLTAMLAKGGVAIRLEPGCIPSIERPGGHRLEYGTFDLPAAAVDGMAKELVPPERMTDYLRGERLVLPYTLNGMAYRVQCLRGAVGTRLVVHEVGPAPDEAVVPATPEGPAPALAGFQGLLGQLLDVGGSDLYLTTQEVPLVRRDGHLQPMEGQPALARKDLLALVKEIAPPAHWEAWQGGQEVEFAVDHRSQAVRLRFGLFQDTAGPAAAVRIMPRQIPAAADLGLSPAVCRLAQGKKGLVIISGAAGSGRTTTLACLLQEANAHREEGIFSLEDAIEFELPTGRAVVRQREVGHDPVRHKRALRAALRQCPDILGAGELREAETVELALSAAAGGMLVLATMAAGSVVETLFQLVEQFPRDRQSSVRIRLAANLKAVLCQTLLRRIGGGRIAAIETLFTNPAIAELLREGRIGEIPAAMKGGRYGQANHNDALVTLIQRGQVEPMEAYLKCNDRESFIAACKKAGIPFDPRSEGSLITTE